MSKILAIAAFAVSSALFSASAIAEEINLGARDFVKDMGNGVILHEHYNPRTGEWTREYKVLDKDYTFVFGNGDKQTIAGAADYEATKDGLDNAMNGRPNGEMGQDRPFPGTGIERPEANPDVDEGFGVGGQPVDRPMPGTGQERPHPGSSSSVDRPLPTMPGGTIQQTTTNSNNIAAMGEAFEQRVDTVNGYLEQTGQAIQATNNKVDSLSQSFQSQAAKTAAEITRLDGRIDALEEKTDRMKAGIAGAAAIGSLTQYVGNGDNHLGMAIGGYDGASAIAAGYTRAINKQTTLRATMAYDSENEITWGASVGHSW